MTTGAADSVLKVEDLELGDAFMRSSCGGRAEVALGEP